MRRLLAGLLLLFAMFAAPLAAQPPLDPAVQQFLDSLHPRTGSIAIPEAKATLELGDDYLFYGPEDAAAILVEAWGNPPESAQGVLGLVMPAGTTPLSDSWGAVVTYEDTGYVSDDDAAEADYDQILADLKEASAASNDERRAAGFQTVNVVGWAQAPRYDKASHSVVWARNLKFEGESVNTLNYDVRALGRSGVLSLNLVSTMPELASIRGAADDFAGLAQFDPGARYEDFDASVDRKAEYGIGGLVAAGVGLAAAKKLGLFAILAKFLKPILIGLAVLFFALWGKIKRLLGRDDTIEDEEWNAYVHDESDGEGAQERPGEGRPIEVSAGESRPPGT
jgi:uncharacterized membrane-anchored protein